MRRLTIVFAILAMLAIATPAAADDGSRDGRGRVFGPYASSSPDSGTCGNDWANDTFERVFTVSRNADGTYTLREDFKDGKFVTIAGVSPGACETSSPHGLTVPGGVRGEFSGYLAGPVTGGTFQAAGGCPDPCTGTDFVRIHFGPTATWDTPTWRFRYHAESDGLRYNRWQNASDDQGGNQGDIASRP